MYVAQYKFEAGTEAALLHSKLVEAMPGVSEEQVFLEPLLHLGEGYRCMRLR